jgi:hypothetical protein
MPLLFRSGFYFFCIVLFYTHVLPAQDSKTSQIPAEEAQFTPEQLQQYYVVYKNPDVLEANSS